MKLQEHWKVSNAWTWQKEITSQMLSEFQKELVEQIAQIESTKKVHVEICRENGHCVFYAEPDNWQYQFYWEVMLPMDDLWPLLLDSDHEDAAKEYLESLTTFDELKFI